MAEDLRQPDSDPRDLKRRRSEVAIEAMRQSEAALYTSTMLYIWLRRVRVQQRVITLAPIVLTALAGFSYVRDWMPAWGVAVLAFLSTLIPAVAEKLEIETHVDDLKRLAAEYKSLQDRFRILAKIATLGSIAHAEQELSNLMDRIDVVRSSSVTPPEKYFELAQKKIKAGHYDFSIDIHLRDEADGPTADPVLPSR